MKRLIPLFLTVAFFFSSAWADPRIIYPTDEDEGVAIVTPATNNAIHIKTGEWLPLLLGDSLPDGYRWVTPEDVAKKDIPAGKPYKIIDSSEIPVNRILRDAWEYSENGIVINQGKAAALSKPPVISQLKATFSNLPIETQAAFGPLAAAVFMFLDQGNPEAAKLIIQRAQIPAELEKLRAQMLEAF